MKCIKCGIDTPNKKFCSRSCAASYNNIGVVRNGVIKPSCTYCGNKVTSKNSTTKFCSIQCHVDYKWIKTVHDIKSNKNVTALVLRKYLISTDLKCVECGITSEYNGKIISLELDHIDGDSSNNVLNNVRLLCPNCHSQTATYKYKNAKNPLGKDHRKARYFKNVKLVAPEGLEPPYSNYSVNVEVEAR